MSVRVKICGVCTVADARAAVAAGADFVGVNFVPGSPRRIAPARAREIAAAIPGTPLVGVFVDAARAEVEDIAAAVGLAMLQFHGEESPEYCAGWPWRTVKALRARPGTPLVALAARYPTDFVLVDTFVPGVYGGSGVALDPEAAARVPPERLFVAGGLLPDTVGAVVRRLRPFAVDVASGVESRPGEKDHAKLAAFVRAAKAA
jgi:phosphoribosylanthranilate isomerase